MTVRTTAFRLIPATVETLRADLAGPAALAAALGHPVPPGWPPEYYDTPAREWNIARLVQTPEAGAWYTHYILAGDERVAGIAGYKGPPAPDGTVEIGYSVLTEYRGQGIAAEAARQLVDQAFRSPEVRRVIAETLPRLIPSLRVLEKNGFRPIGEGSEPGVIRFELARQDYESGRRDIPDFLRHFVYLLGHQTWADHRALDAVEQAGGTHATALTLLSHILGAEHIWYSRLAGQPPRHAVWPELTTAECRVLATENDLAFREFIFGLNQSGLRRIVGYRNSAGQELDTAVEDILLHVFLHGAYHRGQVAQMLRLSDALPASTDYIGFARGTPAATRQVK